MCHGKGQWGWPPFWGKLSTVIPPEDQRKNAGLTPASGPSDLTGQVGLVTGAARGIGRAIALALAADVANRPAVEGAVARTVAHFGRLDVVVNNAGVAERLSLEALDDATLQRELDVIVKGTMLVSQ